MQIWHDDLGLQEDEHELQIAPVGIVTITFPAFWRISPGDTAVASGGEESFGWTMFHEFYRTIYLLMLAGF